MATSNIRISYRWADIPSGSVATVLSLLLFYLALSSQNVQRRLLWREVNHGLKIIWENTIMV
jgi:hypothetical protein